MYTDIGTRLMGSTASPPVAQDLSGATSAGVLSTNHLNLLAGIRAGEVPRSLGEGVDLTAVFTTTVPFALASGANGTADFQIIAIPGTSLAAVALTSITQVATINDALFTRANHGLPNGTALVLTTSGGLPTGLALATHYYVVEATTDTFKVSLTPGGAIVDISTAGTGTHSFTVLPTILGCSGPIPFQRLKANQAVGVRLNHLPASVQHPRHKNVFGRVIPSGTLAGGGAGGSVICDLVDGFSSETLYYPVGQIA